MQVPYGEGVASRAGPGFGRYAAMITKESAMQEVRFAHQTVARLLRTEVNT